MIQLFIYIFKKETNVLLLQILKQKAQVILLACCWSHGKGILIFIYT